MMVMNKQCIVKMIRDNSKKYWTNSKNKCQKSDENNTQNLAPKLKLNPWPIILIKTALLKGIISRIIRELQAMHSSLTLSHIYTHFAL